MAKPGVVRATTDGIDADAVKREAKGAAETILVEPEVEAAIETLRRFIDKAASPVEGQFSPDVAGPYRRTIQEGVLRGVSDRLKKGK